MSHTPRQRDRERGRREEKTVWLMTMGFTPGPWGWGFPGAALRGAKAWSPFSDRNMRISPPAIVHLCPCVFACVCVDEPFTGCSPSCEEPGVAGAGYNLGSPICQCSSTGCVHGDKLFMLEINNLCYLRCHVPGKTSKEHKCTLQHLHLIYFEIEVLFLLHINKFFLVVILRFQNRTCLWI